jgi:hypothetical protein
MASDSTLQESSQTSSPRLPSYFDIQVGRLPRQDQEAIAAILEYNIKTQPSLPVDTGAGRESVDVHIDEGKAKISMLHYMWLQNNGTRPYLMTGLQGKIIPIRTPQGVIFRRATNIGERRISARDARTGQIQKGNRPIAWRHPGLQARHFVELGIKATLPYVGMYMLRDVSRQLAGMTLDG